MMLRTQWYPFQDLRSAQEERAQNQMDRLFAHALGLHGQGASTLPMCRHHAVDPFRVVRPVGHVGEDLVGTTGNLDAVLYDRGHLASFVTIFCLISLVIQDRQVELA